MGKEKKHLCVTCEKYFVESECVRSSSKLIYCNDCYIKDHKHPEGFKCKQCGKCCFAYNTNCTSISELEYKAFENAGRKDILDRIEILEIGKEIKIYDVWFSPITRQEVARCPFIRKLPNKDKYKCMINDLKLDMCRAYPQLTQKEDALRIGCKGWEE